MKPTRTKVPLSDQIDHIMDHFDFAKVESVMGLLNWTWGDPESPDQSQLRKMARERLRAVNDECCYSSCGGFTASIDRWGQLTLEFVLTDWDASDYCAVKDGRDN